MKKMSSTFILALCILFSFCTFLYAPVLSTAYYIYKVTKLGLSYTGADTPEVEIPLSEVFDFQYGLGSPFYASDNVIYRGEISDGTITGIWVYITEVYEYDEDGNLLNNYSTAAWFDCRTGYGPIRTNLNVAVSENERAKIIVDYTDTGYVVSKEAL